MKTQFTCSVCRLTKENDSDFTTGYGVDANGNKVCYDCCGKQDSETLAGLPIGGRHTLYLTDKAIVNWPGTLSIPTFGIRKSWHNFAGRDGRRDVWFDYKGNSYHGVNIGNSQILHVKRIKA